MKKKKFKISPTLNKSSVFFNAKIYFYENRLFPVNFINLQIKN